MRWLGVWAEMVRWLVVIHACFSAAMSRRSSRVLRWVEAAARLSSRRAVTVAPLARSSRGTTSTRGSRFWFRGGELPSIAPRGLRRVGIRVKSGLNLYWSGCNGLCCNKILRVSPEIATGSWGKDLGIEGFLGRTVSPEFWVWKSGKRSMHRWIWVCDFAFPSSTDVIVLVGVNLVCAQCTYAVYSKSICMQMQTYMRRNAHRIKYTKKF